jgi:hypothetical protein
MFNLVRSYFVLIKATPMHNCALLAISVLF